MAQRAALEEMPQDWTTALAVVAHPDDLEYGAAAAVAGWTAAGKDVRYVLVTRGEAGIDSLEPESCARVREAEQIASAAAVGVSSVEFLGHRDGVIEAGPGLRRDLAAAVRRHRPELLITLNHDDTWGGTWWNTPDHRIVGRAVLDAAGDAGNRWIMPDIAAGGGPGPWDGVRWTAVAGAAGPTHSAPVDDEAFERAVASLAEHHAYITGLGVPDSPREYARTFLGGTLGAPGGGRAVTFRVHPR